MWPWKKPVACSDARACATSGASGATPSGVLLVVGVEVVAAVGGDAAAVGDG